MYALKISVPGGVRDTDDTNNYFYSYDATSQYSFQKISTGEIGNIPLGASRQKNDACKRAAVGIEVSDNSLPYKQLIEGREYEFVTTYTNKGAV